MTDLKIDEHWYTGEGVEWAIAREKAVRTKVAHPERVILFHDHKQVEPCNGICAPVELPPES